MPRKESSYEKNLKKINNRTYQGQDETGNYSASGKYEEVIPRGYSTKLKKNWTKQRDETGKMYYVSGSGDSTHDVKIAYPQIKKTSSADDAGRREEEDAQDLEANARAKKKKEQKNILKKIKEKRAKLLQSAKTELKNNNISDWDVYITNPKDGETSKLYWVSKSTKKSQWKNPVSDILKEREKKAKEKEINLEKVEKQRRDKTHDQLVAQERQRRREEINAIRTAPPEKLHEFEPKTPRRQIQRPKTPTIAINAFGSNNSNKEAAGAHKRNKNRANRLAFQQSKLTRQRIDAQDSERIQENNRNMNNNPHHHVREFIQKAISGINHAPPQQNNSGKSFSLKMKAKQANTVLAAGNIDTAKSILKIIPTVVYDEHHKLQNVLARKMITDNTIQRSLFDKLSSLRKNSDTVTNSMGRRITSHVPYYKNQEWMRWVTTEKVLAKTKIDKLKVSDKTMAINRLNNFYTYYYTVFPEFHKEKKTQPRVRRQIPNRIGVPVSYTHLTLPTNREV